MLIDQDNQDIQDIPKTISIFTAFTIGGGLMGLPDTAYTSGWLLSIFAFLLITLTFWAIYWILIRSRIIIFLITQQL